MLMKNNFFSVDRKDNSSCARTGIVKTPHGVVKTPFFAVVGTNATVRSLSSEEIIQTGTQLVLANTYHLHLRPKESVVKKHGV